MTRPSASKNLFGTWKIASISPPCGHQAHMAAACSRQMNSPALHSMPCAGPSLSTRLTLEDVGLLDVDVLVVGQHRARRKPHQRGHQAGLAIEQQRLGFAAGKRVFCHSMLSGRTRCECVSAVCAPVGVTASMAILRSDYFDAILAALPSAASRQVCAAGVLARASS